MAMHFGQRCEDEPAWGPPQLEQHAAFFQHLRARTQHKILQAPQLLSCSRPTNAISVRLITC